MSAHEMVHLGHWLAGLGVELVPLRYEPIGSGVSTVALDEK